MSKVKINKSVLKREKQDQTRRLVNHAKKQTMRTYIKRARKNPSEEAFTIAQKHIDKNVKHNVIHANAGARLKSRLSKLGK